MSNSAYFEQIEQRINTLLSEKKYKESFSLCKDYILKYPEENRFSKLKEKIEKAVEIENENIIERKIKEIEPLWKQENYNKILQTLKDLLRVSPNNNKLKRLFENAQIAYKKQFEKLEAQFEEQQKERLNTLLKENPEQLVEDLYILEKENQNNTSVKTLVTEFRNKLITKKIKEKEELLNSEKYEAIENFIDTLLKIDKYNPQIQKLEETINERKIETNETQSKEYVYSGEKHLDTLMKLKKYDKAIKVANEILQVQKDNSYAQNILKNAQKKYETQLEYLAADNIIKNLPELKAEYRQDKNQFIKL